VIPLPVALGGIGAAVVGVAGIAILRRPQASKVIGAVNGVEVLSNPRLVKGVAKDSWAVPSTGSVFGIAPAPRVSKEHVDQGFLGDCWNIAGMGSIADRTPKAIEGLVEEAGDYVIVHMPGRSVAVTRELPWRKGEPAFAGSDQSDPVYWAAYVEKAQAAVAPNGYRSLVGGHPRITYRQLLGSDPQVRRVEGSPAAHIAELNATGQPITANTRSKAQLSRGDVKRARKLNVILNHSYIVRREGGTLAPATDSARGARLLTKLFNPWGGKHPKRPVPEADVQRLFASVETPLEVRTFSS